MKSAKHQNLLAFMDGKPGCVILQILLQTIEMKSSRRIRLEAITVWSYKKWSC
jgi:hypothetical protein